MTDMSTIKKGHRVPSRTDGGDSLIGHDHQLRDQRARFRFCRALGLQDDVRADAVWLAHVHLAFGHDDLDGALLLPPQPPQLRRLHHSLRFKQSQAAAAYLSLYCPGQNPVPAAGNV